MTKADACLAQFPYSVSGRAYSRMGRCSKNGTLDEMLRVRWRRGLPPVIRTLERGLVTSLSCDSESTSSGDCFRRTILHTTLMFQKAGFKLDEAVTTQR